MSRPFDESPLRQVTRADGVSREIRIHDGHLFVCYGCCCGRTEKGFPPLPLDEWEYPPGFTGGLRRFAPQWAKKVFRSWRERLR